MIRKVTRTSTIVSSKKQCLYKSSKPNLPELDRLISSLRGVKTKSGWCLGAAVEHLSRVDDGRLAKLIVENGVPKSFHVTDNDPLKPDTFRSLIRIVTGQQLNGNSAEAAWKRTCEVFGGESKLSPNSVINKMEDYTLEEGIESLKNQAGISRAKAKTVVEIASRFVSGSLSDEILTNSNLTNEELKDILTSIKGIGEWSYTMFAIFELHRPDILPIGDLGVRRGIGKIFKVKGSGPRGDLCLKKDASMIEKLASPYSPYRSLLAWYMWRDMDSIV